MPATSKPRPAPPTAAKRPPEPVEDADGRHARRERNKVAVVDAYLDLIREGVARPSVNEVADRSGVSHRSVFRYFADKDEMARTSIQRQMARVSTLLSVKVDASAPLGARVDDLLAMRLQLFEHVAPSARLSRSLASSQPILQQELTAARAALRTAVRRIFAKELARLSSAEAADALAVLDVLTSFEAVDLLRSDQGLSKPRAARALRRAILAVLGQPDA